MPIKPENMAAYPGGSIKSPQWQAIRSYIRARAGDRCEACGERHLAYGYRDASGVFIDLGMDQAKALEAYLEAMYYAPTEDIPNFFRMVCTVAHIDGKLIDHSTMNLAFWCPRVHNRHDAKSRAETAGRTRRAKSGEPSIIDWLAEHA